MLGNTWFSATRPLSLLSAYTWDACHQVPLSSDLSHLVAEIRALRGQLEQSIQVNNCLRLQLEQQLDGGASKAGLSSSSVNQKFPTNTDPGNKQPFFQGRKEKGIMKPSASGKVPRMCVVEGTILPLPHSLGSGWSQRCFSTVPWGHGVWGKIWLQILSLPLTCCLP